MSEKEIINQSENETLGLKKIIVNYIHQWKVFVIVGILSLIPAILYLFLVPKTYEIFARIQIQEDSSGGAFGLGEAAGLMKSFGLGGGGGTTVNMDDEMTILASNSLLRQVIHQLDLQVAYMKPGAFRYKMYKGSPLLLDFDEETNANIMDALVFEVSVDKSEKVKVKVKSNDIGKYKLEYPSLPAVIELPLGTFTLSKNTLGDPEIKAPFKMKINVNPASWVAEDLAEELGVEDVSNTSNILELTIQDYEKKRGVDFLNTLVAEFNRQYENTQKQNVDKSMTFIDGRIQNVIAELDEAEGRIQQFKAKNGMTELEYDIEFYVGQMSELQTKIIELEAEKYVVTMLDDYVKDPANKFNVIPMLLSAAEGEKGGPIATYNIAVIERNTILKSSKTESPLIKQKDEQLDNLREGVFQTIRNAHKALEVTLADLKGKENQLLAKMGEVPSMERELVDYRRQQEIYQGVYLILLQKREDAALRIGEMKEHARMVDDPFVKQKKVAPRKLYALIFVMLLTMIIPVAWIEGRKIFKELKKEFQDS